MVTNRLSRIFYRIAYVYSIVSIVVSSLGLLIINIVIPTLLASYSWPMVDSTTGQEITSTTMIAIDILYTVIFGICLLCSIMTLVYSKKGLTTPTKKSHICSIVWGAIAGLGFSVAAGILGLVALSHEPNNISDVKDVESKDIK